MRRKQRVKKMDNRNWTRHLGGVTGQPKAPSVNVAKPVPSVGAKRETGWLLGWTTQS